MVRAAAFLLVAGVVLPLPLSVHAATHTVMPDGTGDFPTIQAAIDSSMVTGDIIVLGDGTFIGPGNRDLDLLGKQLVIRSQSDHPEACVIDCDSSGIGVRFEHAEESNTVLSGVTITNGYTTSSGGGIYCTSSPTIQNCIISNCVCDFLGGGVFIENSSEGPTMIECVVTGNRCGVDGGGIYWSGEFCSDIAPLVNCTIMNNTAEWNGGGVCLEQFGTVGSEGSIQGCVFETNDAKHGHGGGLYLVYAYVPYSITDCLFLDNTTGGSGGGCFLNGAHIEVSGCKIAGNLAHGYGGGIDAESVIEGVMRNCVITENEAICGGGGLRHSYTDDLTLGGCTVSGNRTDGIGGGMVVGGNTYVAVDTTIVWGNCADSLGSEVYFEDPEPTIRFTCSDIDTNGVAGEGSADWTTDYNIFDDPIFCGPEDCNSAPTTIGNYYLHALSPCLDEICGQIGALPEGCRFEPQPVILSINDVANDQGGQVRLRWQRSVYDAQGDTIDITGYGVYRQEGQETTSPLRAGDQRFADYLDRGLRLDGWDYIVTLPAHGDSAYQCVAPTLCDSTAEEGTCWSVFLIRAMTANPFVFYDSPPDSGYSVDNLAPAPPANLRWDPIPILTWNEAEEEDFDYFTVYGSANAEFDETAEVIGYTSGTSMDMTGNQHEYCHVTATDFAGNEGGASGMNTLSVDTSDLPAAYRLAPNSPNPFPSTTTISFDLPQPSVVRLEIYDVTGRLMRRLVNADRPAGRHAVIWSKDDDSGRTVASGVYAIRFEAGSFTQTRRIVVLE